MRDWVAAEGGRGAAATLQAPPVPRVGDARVRFRALSNPAEGVSLLAAAGACHHPRTLTRTLTLSRTRTRTRTLYYCRRRQ